MNPPDTARSVARIAPPRAGYCHNAYCDEKSTFVVRVRRIDRNWTTGVDYCEQHAHETAQKMRENFKIVVEPLLASGSDS